MRPRSWLALLVMASAAHAGAGEARRWEAARAGLTFELTSDDLRAWRAGQQGAPVFSVRQLLAADEARFRADAEERAREAATAAFSYPEPIASAFSAYAPLSAVGSLVSLLETSEGYSPGAAHPWASRAIVARDAARGGEPASLLDLYSERQIVEALAADPWILGFEPAPAAGPRPASLQQLVDVLNAAAWDAARAAESCDRDAHFGVELVHGFAFHHLDGDRVAIRIGIPHASEVCRGTLHQVGLLLPVPEGLREELEAARRSTAGFLMADRERLGAPEISGHWEVDLRRPGGVPP